MVRTGKTQNVSKSSSVGAGISHNQIQVSRLFPFPCVPLCHTSPALPGGTAHLPAPSARALSFHIENVLSQGDIVGEGIPLLGEPLHLVSNRFSEHVPAANYQEPTTEFEMVRKLAITHMPGLPSHCSLHPGHSILLLSHDTLVLSRTHASHPTTCHTTSECWLLAQEGQNDRFLALPARAPPPFPLHSGCALRALPHSPPPPTTCHLTTLDVPRRTLISANKEGLVSLTGNSSSSPIYLTMLTYI
jgi:hypothetical protein